MSPFFIVLIKVNLFMFSSRLQYDFGFNKLSVLLKKIKSSGIDIIDLTSSNPTKNEFIYNKKDILKIFSDTEFFDYNPDPKGDLNSRLAICDYYSKIGYKIDPEKILIVPSTSVGYSYVFKLLTNPGDEILLPSPSYPLFDFLATMENIKAVNYKLKYDNKTYWSIDFESLDSNFNMNTKAVIVVNPNNPTGSYITKDDKIKIIEFCKNKKISLIVDEVFFDYLITEEPYQTFSFCDTEDVLTFVLNGFSKMLILPQLKFGWIYSTGEKSSEATEYLELISDTYLSVSNNAQKAAQGLLNYREYLQEQVVNRIRINYNILKSELLLNPDIKVLKVFGGWNAVISFKNLLISDEDFVCRLLEKEHVLIHPGYFYDFNEEGYAVLSLLIKSDIFAEGITRINKFIKF